MNERIGIGDGDATRRAGWRSRIVGGWRRRFVGAPTETRAEDRVGFGRMVLYGFGAFVNNGLGAAIGGMLIVLNLALGMDPAMVGLIGALPRLADAFIDPLMGYISDHTRSRWGRRRPYLFVGAIASGLTYAALWWLPSGHGESFTFWWFLIGSMVFYVAYTVFAAPWVAMGYELTPDYHERTRLMGVQNFIGQLAYLVAPWFLWFMSNRSWFANPMVGARWLAVLIGGVAIALGVLPALFLRERLAAAADTKDAEAPAARGLAASAADFARGMRKTLSSGPFLKLSAVTFLVFNGFVLVGSFQSYIIIYHVFRGDQHLGATWAGYAGTVGSIATFVVISLVTWMATRVGKRGALVFSTGVSMLGFAAKWICYDPNHPTWLLVPSALTAFGLGGLFTVMGSMIADVVDEDELHTQQRREGMYGSVFWWVVKLGMAAALAGGGLLLKATGFDVGLGADQPMGTITMMRLADAFLPLLTSAVALWALGAYPITEHSARATREELERRRGRGDVAPAEGVA